MIGLDILHYGILSEQVEDNRLLEILVHYQKIVLRNYLHYGGWCFFVFGTGTQLSHPSTVFENTDPILVIFASVATGNASL